MQYQMNYQPATCSIRDISKSNSDLLLLVYHGATMVTMEWLPMLLNGSVTDTSRAASMVSSCSPVVVSGSQWFSAGSQWLPVLLNSYQCFFWNVIPSLSCIFTVQHSVITFPILQSIVVYH